MASAPPSRELDSTQSVPEEETSCSAHSTSRGPAEAKYLVEPHFSDFWAQLALDIVERTAWKVERFDSFTSLDAFFEDVRHYPFGEERIRMKQRRNAALRLRSKPKLWSALVFAAFRELASDSPGHAVATLAHSGLLVAFKDFAIHTHYFQVTRKLMESAGVTVSITANASSCIHDIDKLDPIMLTGYSERWEDARDTALWHVCVDSHFALNTHHQQNELWHSEDCDDKEKKCWKAMPELLCDKASPKLQKELNGIVSPEM
ncbi:uncharacterized protein LOC125945262 isoform X2 [Dermacentor silvarum]|uniref:uncharacterized protein LOC125945262 isoform X2 n=1 Tax=Dermacentor silvarum TaxID=543639 RepID=UPI002101586E|nr:uncharacterized protein LOC125945262 isoform X2 [Dermacentor silvarum]